MAQCAFGTLVVNDTCERPYEYAKNLEGRLLFIRDGQRVWLYSAFDFSYRFRSTCLHWRRGISEATGIPVESIWTQDLQTHEGPTARQLAGEASERLVEACVPVVCEMMGRAEQAELSWATADLGHRWNHTREQYVPGLGMVTVWQGLEFDEDHRGWTSDPSIMLLGDWKPDLPAFRDRIYFDRPNDAQGALLVFRSARTGEVLGHISRFTAHAAIVGGPGLRGNMDEYRNHPDWPAYLREAIEDELGGVGVAVCGPTGDTCPNNAWARTHREAVAECQRIALGVAGELLSAFHVGATPWEPLRLGPQARTTVELPMRESVPASRESLDGFEPLAKHMWEEVGRAKATGEPAYRIKQMIDRAWTHTYMKKMITDWLDPSDEELATGILRNEVHALRLNDLALAGGPGESMVDTTLWLRANSLGDRLIMLDQINGYTVYMTTREQYDLGGYAAWCSVLDRDAEWTSRAGLLGVIREAMSARG